MNQNTISSSTMSFVTFDPGTLVARCHPPSQSMYMDKKKLICSVLLGKHEIRNEELRWLIGYF